MERLVATAYTETAWDALQDGMELVLRLYTGPASASDLARATGDDVALVEHKLRRLAKAGLIQGVHERWEVVARYVHQTRQEGMVTSLTRYVLPSLARAAREPGAAVCEQLDLRIAPDEQIALRKDLWALSEELNEISLRIADDQVACTAVMVATSDVPKSSDSAEKMLETVRRAARQRATPGAADGALVRQFDALFGKTSIPDAERAVRAFGERLRVRECPAGERATYTLLLGFFVRGESRANGGEDET